LTLKLLIPGYFRMAEYNNKRGVATFFLYFHFFIQFLENRRVFKINLTLRNWVNLNGNNIR